jgi:hypothetical protein
MNMNLKIEYVGGKNLGRCYNASYYRITSKYPLPKVTLEKLFHAGVLGIGQEFGFNTLMRDGILYPDVIDVIEDNVNMKYYVYHTYCNCDSGD